MALLRLNSARVVEKRRKPSPMLYCVARRGPLSAHASSKVRPTWSLPPPSGTHLVSSCHSLPMLGVRGPTSLLICSAPRQARQSRWSFPLPPKGRPPGLCLPARLHTLCRFSPVLGVTSACC